MKICYICYNLHGQGTYWRAFHFGRVLAEMGHEVSILCTSPTTRMATVEKLEAGVRVVQTPDLFRGSLRSGWDPWNIFNRLIWLRAQSFDIVHAFESRPTVIYPALSLKRRGAALFMDWCDWFGRGGSVEERPSPLVRTVLRPVETFFEENFRTAAAGTTVICNTLYEKAAKLGVAKEKILLVRNGVNIELFKPANKASSREKFGLAAHHFVIGFLGSLFSKDAELMIESFRKVLALKPDARLVLINFRCPKSLALEGVEQKVIQRSAPVEDDMVEILDACDVFWLPLTDCGANWGRFPIKLGIYAAMGKPTVSTRVGDSAQLIEQFNFGKVSAPGAGALAAATLELSSPSERSSMSERARAYAQVNFNWQQNGGALNDYYAWVLKDHGWRNSR